MNALHTWGSWLQVCIASGGSSNGFRGPDGTWYYLDSTPRHLQNGAIVGRVHAQRRGEPMVDVGAFKIAGDGQVVQVPAEIAALLPARSLPPVDLAELSDYPDYEDDLDGSSHEQVR